MISRRVIDEFLAQRSLALAGVSRNGKGFGNVVRRELKAKGYDLRLIHPEADSIDGQAFARNVREVASKVGGLILVTPPEATLSLVREAAEAGIRRIWMQQGAESPEAIRFCEEHGMSVVHGHCILMFPEPTGLPHALHRWLLRVFRRLPR